MIRHPRKNPFCIPFLIINQAIETHQVAFVRVRKAFSSGKMEGSAGAGHSLAPTGCSKPNAPLQSPPGREVQDSAQPNPRAEGEGANRAEEAEETSGPPRIPAVDSVELKITHFAGDKQSQPQEPLQHLAERGLLPCATRF